MIYHASSLCRRVCGRGDCQAGRVLHAPRRCRLLQRQRRGSDRAGVCGMRSASADQSHADGACRCARGRAHGQPDCRPGRWADARAWRPAHPHRCPCWRLLFRAGDHLPDRADDAPGATRHRPPDAVRVPRSQSGIAPGQRHGAGARDHRATRPDCTGHQYGRLETRPCRISCATICPHRIT